MPIRIRIKDGWAEAGQFGSVLGPNQIVKGLEWTPVIMDGEDDPSWHKTHGLDFLI